MRINFTESTLTTLKRTANCSYANAVYKLTMKAQQGLKCDDIYKKSVLMHEVNKLLCKYNLSETVYFNSTYSSLLINVAGIGVLFSVFIGGEQVATDLSRQELYYYLISLGWRDNANLGPNSNSQLLQIPAYLLAQYSNLQDIVIAYESNDIIYITRNDESSSVTSAIALGSYTAVDYTEEELNCITPQDLQVLYEFTHKYKETAAKSSKKITAPSSTNNTTQDSNCCTWGSITGNIGNQSDLVNYLATVEKNMIAVEDEGTEITNDVKSINFIGTNVTATDDGNGNVTVNVTGGGGTAFQCSDLEGCNISLLNNDAGYITDATKYTVDNGLNENPTNNFRLGGTLIENTVIDTDTNYLSIESSTLNGAPFRVGNYNLDLTSDGISVYVEDGVAGVYESNNYSSQSTYPILELKRNSSTNSRTYDELGGAIDFYLKTNSSNFTGDQNGRISCVWNNSSTSNSKMEIWAYVNGIPTRIATFNSNQSTSGMMNFEKYGLGNFIGGTNYLLGVKNDGSITEVDLPVVKTFKQEITMADFKTGNAVSILPAPGVGKAICVIEASFKLNGTTGYSGATGLLCIYPTTSGSSSKKMFDSKDNTFFQTNIGGMYKMADTNTHNASLASNIFENESLSAKVFWTIGPTTGDLSATVYGSYRIIDL